VTEGLIYAPAFDQGKAHVHVLGHWNDVLRKGRQARAPEVRDDLYNHGMVHRLLFADRTSTINEDRGRQHKITDLDCL
jgi:hypothetical protein